jgi:hypothetical protein
MKIRPKVAELFHADGQTDMTKFPVAFRNFANAPKNCNRRAYHTQQTLQAYCSQEGVVYAFILCSWHHLLDCTRNKIIHWEGDGRKYIFIEFIITVVYVIHSQRT